MMMAGVVVGIEAVAGSGSVVRRQRRGTAATAAAGVNVERQVVELLRSAAATTTAVPSTGHGACSRCFLRFLAVSCGGGGLAAPTVFCNRMVGPGTATGVCFQRGQGPEREGMRNCSRVPPRIERGGNWAAQARREAATVTPLCCCRDVMLIFILEHGTIMVIHGPTGVGLIHLGPSGRQSTHPSHLGVFSC